MIPLVVALALAAADPCAGVLDRTPACASPAAAAVVETADARRAEQAPASEAAVVLPPSLAVASVASAVVGVGLLGVSYLYASSLVGALRDGDLRDADRDHLVLAHRATTGASIGAFVASTLLLGTSAAFAAFDPRTGAFLPQIFPSERE